MFAIASHLPTDKNIGRLQFSAAVGHFVSYVQFQFNSIFLFLLSVVVHKTNPLSRSKENLQLNEQKKKLYYLYYTILYKYIYYIYIIYYI